MWEQVIQGQSKAHGPFSRMIKSPFMCQPKSDTWAKIEEGGRQDLSDTD